MRLRAAATGMVAALPWELTPTGAAPTKQVGEWIYLGALAMALWTYAGEISRTEAAEIVSRRTETLDPIVKAITTWDF